jgi:uncharacterized Zn-finger protein
MNEINCPYCEEENEINHDDGYGYEENETYNQECSHCGKYFIYTTQVSFDYEVEKADCLNDGEHNWVKEYADYNIKQYPQLVLKEKCSYCDEKRTLSTQPSQ